MPKGQRAKRGPADAASRAVMAAKIADGEIEDDRELSTAAAELGRKGGRARAAKLSPEQRADIARRAAAKRWKSD